jgi:hypothetical protein
MEVKEQYKLKILRTCVALEKLPWTFVHKRVMKMPDFLTGFSSKEGRK